MVKNISKIRTFTQWFLSYKPKTAKVSLAFSQVAMAIYFDVIWVEFWQLMKALTVYIIHFFSNIIGLSVIEYQRWEGLNYCEPPQRKFSDFLSTFQWVLLNIFFFPSNFNVDKSQSPQSVSNKYVFTEEKLSPQSTFNPGLVLIGFPTARPKTRLGVK